MFLIQLFQEVAINKLFFLQKTARSGPKVLRCKIITVQEIVVKISIIFLVINACCEIRCQKIIVRDWIVFIHVISCNLILK